MAGDASTPTSTCRICGASAPLRALYAFGAQPVAGYLDADEQTAIGAPRFPLTIAICEACGLVQQGHGDARSLLVSKVYSQYHSTYSASREVSAYAEAFVEKAAQLAPVSTGDYAIEIGSNDGAMLRLLAARGLQPVGFEPSGNLNEQARSSGAHIVEDYFGADAARKYRDRFPPAKLIVSRHTLEHAFEPLDFVRGIRAALADNGLAVVEVPYLGLQLVNNHFEAMTFQHICFYTLVSLQRLFSSAHLTVVDARFVGMDGGSIVVFARPAGTLRPAVDAVLASERTSRLDSADGYASFFDRVNRVRQQARAALTRFAEQGRCVIAYGGGGKGQSLLNMVGLDRSFVRAVRDDTIVDGPRWIPGAAIPVVRDGDRRLGEPDVVFVTAPTHIRELLARDPYRDALFVATVPDWHFVPRGRI